MKHDICAKDYSEFVDVSQYRDKNPNKIDRFPFTDEEIKTMWGWSAKNEYVSIFLMLIYTGVRQGELRDLKKGDVHLEERYFYIRQSKTPAGIRNVPIAKKVLPFFKYWMNKESKCEYLITTREGRYFHDRNFRDSYWTVVLNEMGLNKDHKPHDARHTCVSLLTKAGYDVTAVDYTEAMLEEAKKNAGALASSIHFQRMDAQKLDFPDGYFDVVISRNLTWNLEEPGKAYAEWMRVLKKGGRLLNFDANWYHHLFDEEKRKEYEEDRKRVESLHLDDHYTCTDIDAMEDIARQIPMSRIMRPAWDVQVLRDRLGNEVEADEKVWERVWDSTEKANYGSTPMFLVSAVKMGGTKAVCPDKEGYTS
mgnify:CR=1 FL=1